MNKDQIMAIAGILLFVVGMGFVIYLIATSPVETDNNHIFMEMLP